MKNKEKRQKILDYFISTGGVQKIGNWKVTGFTYQQDFINNKNSLISEGYIVKQGKLFIVTEPIYSERILKTDILKEMKRLQEIERKYNKIVKICH